MKELGPSHHGVPAYGSYQSLRVVERELPRLPSPSFVIYGFYDQHEDRNVASAYWLRHITMRSSGGRVEVPFATYDHKQGALVRHAPETYVSLPMRRSLAIVDLIERTYMVAKATRRFRQRRRVTEAILLQMDRVARGIGATFVFF